jgi:hypothetical protein
MITFTSLICLYEQDLNSQTQILVGRQQIFQAISKYPRKKCIVYIVLVLSVVLALFLNSNFVFTLKFKSVHVDII